MAPYDIVQLASMGKEVDAALAQRYRVLRVPGGSSLRHVDSDVSSVRVVVTSVRSGLYRSMLDMLPSLEAVCSWGAGFDTLDLADAGRRGIAVSNTPGVLDGCVADLAWTLLLSVARRVAVGDRYVKDGHWREIGAFPLSTRVSSKRLGILGLGRIGSAIARRGTGFDMQVRYTGRLPRADVPWPYVESLSELAEWSDFLFVACAGGRETRHLVNAEVLRALGNNGILINVARGSVVDQEALISALLSGELGGAGLDVLQDEPSVPPELAGMDRVVLTPHIGSATYETRAEMSSLVLQNVDSFFATGRLLTPIVESRA